MFLAKVSATRSDRQQDEEQVVNNDETGKKGRKKRKREKKTITKAGQDSAETAETKPKECILEHDGDQPKRKSSDHFGLTLRTPGPLVAIELLRFWDHMVTPSRGEASLPVSNLPVVSCTKGALSR